MADVEEALVGEAPSVQELRASDAPEPGSTQRPGGITRHSRSQSPDKTSHALRRSSSPSPSRKAEWKTFSKEYPHKRADVPISDYSKDETIKRKRWEKEKRCVLPSASEYGIPLQNSEQEEPWCLLRRHRHIPPLDPVFMLLCGRVRSLACT